MLLELMSAERCDGWVYVVLLQDDSGFFFFGEVLCVDVLLKFQFRGLQAMWKVTKKKIGGCRPFYSVDGKIQGYS